VGRLIVQQDGQRLVVAADKRTIVSRQPVQRAAVAIAAGPRGPEGPAGTGSAFDVQGVAAEPVQGSRVVALDASDRLVHPDLGSAVDALRVLGIALTSASAAGQAVTVRRRGPVSEAAWAWNEGPVFVGLNGQLTQTPVDPGWLCQIGMAINATTVEVDPQPTIL